MVFVVVVAVLAALCLLTVTVGTFMALCWLAPTTWFVGGMFSATIPLYGSALAITVMAVVPFYITYKLCKWLL